MANSRASQRAFKTLVEYLKDDQHWKITTDEERLLIQTGVSGEHGRYPCYARVNPKTALIVFYSVAGVHVPKMKIMEMAEYVTRANYGMQLGNFELDYSDGETRFKTTIDVRDGELTREMLRALVLINVCVMDRYMPGILQVLYSDVSPKAAIAAVEDEATTQVETSPVLHRRRLPPWSAN